MSILLEQVRRIAEADTSLKSEERELLLQSCANFPDSALLFLCSNARQDPTFLRFFVDNVYEKKNAMQSHDQVRLEQIMDEEESICAKEEAESKS